MSRETESASSAEVARYLESMIVLGERIPAERCWGHTKAGKPCARRVIDTAWKGCWQHATELGMWEDA